VQVCDIPAPERREDLLFLAGLAEAGEFRPVIDRTFPLDEIADVHRRVDEGHKAGNGVIRMGEKTVDKTA